MTAAFLFFKAYWKYFAVAGLVLLALWSLYSWGESKYQEGWDAREAIAVQALAKFRAEETLAREKDRITISTLKDQLKLLDSFAKALLATPPIKSVEYREVPVHEDGKCYAPSLTLEWVQDYNAISRGPR